MRAILAALVLVTLVPSPGLAQRGALAPPLIEVGAKERPVILEAAVLTVEPAAGMARTTIEMWFRNPNARVLEGNLQFPLQPGQQVVGFALDVDGRMREAVPVAKDRGRQIFEAIEREGVDPGLLEQTQGESFRLRVYPFPANGTRRVRVDIVEPLRQVKGGSAVTLPLAFAAGLNRLEVRTRGPQPPRVEGAQSPLEPTRAGVGLYRVPLRTPFNPGRGISLVFPASRAPAVQAQSHDGGRYFVADVPVDVQSRPRVLPARVGVIWDSSTSGAHRAHDLELALLDDYFRAAHDTEVDLIRLRDVAEPAERFRVRGGDWSALRRELESTVYDGATNIDGWIPDIRVLEYLLFSDGLFNYGLGSFPAFSAEQRLYAVQAGAAGDSTRLASLANVRHGRQIQLSRRDDLDSAVRALLHDETRLVEVQGIGATDLLAESPSPVDGRLRIAGRLRETEPRLILHLTGPDGPVTTEIVLPETVDGRMAAWLWARYRLAELQADPERHRAAITRLGADFGLVTPQTSLIVLERAEDYARHDIAPPAELQAQVSALLRQQNTLEKRERSERLERIAGQWQERIDWWEKPFPKDKARSVGKGEPPVVFDEPSPIEALAPPSASARVAPAPAAAEASAATSTSLDRIQVTGSRMKRAEIVDLADDSGADAMITLKPWQPDSPVARRLRTAAADLVYPLYLDERAREAQGTAFYLDVADILFEKEQPELALRVLSNLAEMQLEDRHILRVLAYRLLQAGRADLAVPVLERVLAIGGEEPQSYRDLALAHAALGHRQQAIDLLQEIVIRDWDGRFPDIEITALAELNALAALSPTPVDTSRIDRRFVRNLPVGLRTVLSWDTDNSDMDLHVTDPDGEEAFYSNPLTRQGGRMSDDFTGGYGPEEFVLRDPKPGTYKVEAVYFSDRQQIVTGAPTLNLWLSTGFGTVGQKDQRITLRLLEKKDRILVGEFEVR